MASLIPDRPWVFHEQGEANEYCLLTADRKGWVMAMRLNGEMYVDRHRAILDHVVRCVNAHDALLKAAQDALLCMDRMLRDGEWYAAQERADALREAVAAAKPGVASS